MMLDWIENMTSADLSNLAAIYSRRAGDAARKETRESFGRLATQFTVFAATRKAEERNSTRH
jgi:hypothetical protein